ncbi:acetyl-CoA hydrolase/transferase C-terminal domain-containing protein [Pseudonocardia humida]|nr:acetyl-CoA hydrolase/transferase C-terminal domain-containing protein [Pseudonocardia humida]
MGELGDLVRPGMRVAVGDGCGAPRALFPGLVEAARRRGDVSLLLGWLPRPEPELDLSAFADVATVLGGAGLRAGIEAGTVRRIPCRLSAAPAVLAGPLRPDLLLATVVRGPDGLHLGAEVAWMRGLVEAGVPVAAVVSAAAPLADAGPALPEAALTVVAEVDGPAGAPAVLDTPPPTPADEAIAAHVATLVPHGARVQVGPGRLAAAMVAALEVPVRMDSGMLPDPVVDLDARGLLLDEPVAAYLVGTPRLYAWAHGRRLLHPVEVVHDIGRLSHPDLPPLIALNTALEIDHDGQVNVEGLGGRATGMIGGHPDFAAAGARSRDGLSVVALAARHRSGATLVERLSGPVTTASHDVDVVVTDDGIADLRGRDRAQRRAALRDLWGV